MAETQFLPDFLVIGAAKSGTTSLYHQLNCNPDLQMSLYKEPAYFLHAGKTEVDRPHPITGQLRDRLCFTATQYSSQFEDVEASILRGDASTDYMANPEVCVANIRFSYDTVSKPYPKLICVLRDPVERAWAQYLMHVNTGIEELSFMEATKEEVTKTRISQGWPESFDYLGYGMYSKHLKAWSVVCPSPLIIPYRRYVDQPRFVLSEIAHYLGVSDDFNVDTNLQFNKGARVSQNYFSLSSLVQRPTKLKRLVKLALPRQFRQELKRQLLNALKLRKEECPPEVREYLRCYYESELESLMDDFSVAL